MKINMKRMYKLITWPLAAVFLTQNIAWGVPTPQPLAIGQESRAVFVPNQYGSIEKYHDPYFGTGTPGTKGQIVLIKDAHCNYEAQTNIAKILDTLIRDYKIDLVCVEGSEGFVNTSPFNAYPDKEAKNKITDKYIKKGVLSASEALSISRGNEQPFSIWGVEDSKLYLEDFRAFRETLIDNVETIQVVSQLIKSTGLLKNKICNPDLLKFDKNRIGYEENKITLSNWIKKLYVEYGFKDKNLILVLKSTRLEKEIDFSKTEQERTELIKELEKTLPKEDLQELVKQSLLFKLGKIPPVEYYTYLERMAVAGSCASLKKYTRLVKIQARIDSDGLFKELSQLESTIYSKLCLTEIEKKLHEIDFNLAVLNKLLNLQMSRQDLEYYKAHIVSFDLKKITEFINIQNGGRLKIDAPSGVSLQSAERFYELAVRRDKVLVSNLLSKMEKDKKQKAAMVIGGFHADGITNRLEKEGISYVVISPKITKIQEDNPYLSIMLDEKIDIDKLIENISQTTLAPPMPLGNMGDAEIRQRLAEDLIKYRNQPVRALAAKYKGIGQEALLELCRVAGIKPEEIEEEERPITEFLKPDLLSERIISEENPTLAAFLFELLKAQEKDNPEGVKTAVRAIANEASDLDIIKLANNYIISTEKPKEISKWHTKLSKLSAEEAGEYDTYMREIGEQLIKLGGITEEEAIRYLEWLDNFILAQDIASEQFAYIPINAKHVLNTARNIIAILNNPNFQNRRTDFEKQYGGKNLRPILLFLSLAHQAGYRMVKAGKPETYARYKELGAGMINDIFGPALQKCFGADTFRDLLDAVKTHGEIKEGILANSNPLLFLLTLAQSMDISARRLEEWQKSPFFIQILKRVTVNDEYIKLKIELESARREFGKEAREFLELKDTLRRLIQDLSTRELEGLRSQKIVEDTEYENIKQALVSVDLEGVDFFLGTAMIEDIQIDFDSDGKLILKVFVADKALEYGSFANSRFYVNLVVERMQRSILDITKEEITAELTSSELRQELGSFIERLPMAELHSHLNGAIDFNRQWQKLVRRFLLAQKLKETGHMKKADEIEINWNNMKGKNINKKLSDLYKRDIDLNKIFLTAIYARNSLVMALKDRRERVSNSTSDLELLPLVDKYIKQEQGKTRDDLLSMLRLYINMRNEFRSLVEYLPVEEGKLPEFVMHFAVGSAVGKTEDRERELKYLENNAFYLAQSSFRANGYYYEYRINLGKNRKETKEELDAIMKGIKRAEQDIASSLQEGEPGFEGRIILSFGRSGDNPETYAKEAREFVEMLVEHPELLEKVVGIDVANQEEGTPPSTFMEAFRIIEEYNRTLSEDKRLQITYHVGEGFTDVSLETSLRFIDEVINFNAKRLGHAIVLGINPEQFSREPREELVSERRKTLEWIKQFSEQLGLEYFTRENIDRELAQLTGEKVKVSYNDTARRDISKIQDYLLKKVIEKDIVIETNPTSNAAIVTGKDMKDLPLRKFLTFQHPVTGQRVKFTINTDDAGIFGTDLRREYLRVAEAFGLSVQQLWEITSQGFNAHMGRPLRYREQILRRLSQVSRTILPLAPAAAVAIGTKSHKAGTPKVAGRDAENRDVDFIIDGLFRQGKARGGFQGDAKRPVVNEYFKGADGRPSEIKFAREDEVYFERANLLIGRNINRILSLINTPQIRQILNAQFGKLTARRNEKEAQLDEMLDRMRKEIRTLSPEALESMRSKSVGFRGEVTAIDKHIDLLQAFINNPEKVLTERLSTAYTLILEGMDFLVFNDSFSYWVGHSSTSRNAIYIPEKVYESIRESSEALAGFLIDELIDAIVGEHTALSDRLIDMLDTKGELKQLISNSAETSYREAYGLGVSISELVNAGDVLGAINKIQGSLSNNSVSPTVLLSVLQTALNGISEKFFSTFAFTLTSSPLIRDALNNIIIEGIMDLSLSSGDLRLNAVVLLIRRPHLLASDELSGLLDSIREHIPLGNGDIVAEEIKIRLDTIEDAERIKRYLAIILLELEPAQFSDKRFRDFVYKVLSLPRLREVYTGKEYVELVIHTLSKLEGISTGKIEFILRQTGIKRQLLSLLPRYKQILSMNIPIEMAEEYTRSKKKQEELVKQKQITLEPDLMRELKNIGYLHPEDFRDELVSLINEKNLLGLSLEAPVTPDALRDAEITVSHIATSGHTIVSLVRVNIAGSVYSFVLKKSYTGFSFSISSNVYNLYQQLAGESKETGISLSRQYGEWIAPLSRDGRLMGYYRTEEYLAGQDLTSLRKKLNEDSEEYRLAFVLAAANYYMLFKYLAKGRWFLFDATAANVMLVPTPSGSLTSRIIDIEARIALPEGLSDQNFITLLENRGFRHDDIITGIGIAELSTGKNEFDLSEDFEPSTIANLVSVIQGEPPLTITEPITVTEQLTLKTAITPEGKVVAIGDVHGELDGLKEILLEAKLIDKDGHWAGDNATLVQLGDIFDRGPDSEGTFKFLLQLQEEAETAGGRVVLLLGNHEWAYLAGEGASGMRLVDLMKKEEEGKATRQEVNEAYREFKEIGRMIADAVSKGLIQAMYAAGNTVFVHAGIRPVVYDKLRNEIALQEDMTIDDITLVNIADYCNRVLAKAVTNNDYSHFIFNVGAGGEGQAEDAGIFWARLNDKAVELPRIQQVVGHSQRKEITRLKGRGIIGIDVGIAGHYGGRRAYLEIPPEGDAPIRGALKHPSGNWMEREFTRAFPAGMAHFEELGIGEDLVYDDGTKAKGVLSTERAKEIKDFIQKNGKEAKTTLGVSAKISDKTEDANLNDLLIENLNRLLDSLPDEERTRFLTALKTHAPPEGLVFAILTQSQHFGENHKGDGFVGINRYLLLQLQKAKDKATIDTLSNLLQVTLYHELRHEAFPEKTEDEQYNDDLSMLSKVTVDPLILMQLGIISKESRLSGDLSVIATVSGIVEGLKALGIEAEGERNRLKDAINSVQKGEAKINLTNLVEIFRSKKMDMFIVAGVVAGALNKYLLTEDIEKRGRMVAAVMERILNLIPEEKRIEEGTEEEKLLRTIQSIAEEKGIDPAEIMSIFDLFKQGMDLLTMDPGLDMGKVDNNYFKLIEQLEKLTGITQGKIMHALNLEPKITDGQDIGLTQLGRKAKLLNAYNELWNDVQETTQAIPGNIKDRSTSAVVVFHIDSFKDMPLVGLRAVLTSIKNGDSVKLGIRVPKGKEGKLKEILRQIWELKDSIILLPEDIGEVKEAYPQAVFVVNKDYTVPKELKGTKIFGIDKESSFHAVFMFGVMYARAEGLDEIKLIIKTLTSLGVPKDEVDEILRRIDKEGLTFFTVKLVRIKETLEEFQNRRITIEIAA